MVIRNLHRHHIPILHSDGQALLSIKRLQALQRPVVTFLIFGNLN